jgi:hypothetical protein
MFNFMEGLPEDVLAVEASGKLTHEDYQAHLIPKADELIQKYGKIKLLYFIGDDFDGFELSALWDDTAYGLRHWSDVTHIALVTDQSWMQSMLTMFAPFFPGEVKIFTTNMLEQAKEWISGVA